MPGPWIEQPSQTADQTEEIWLVSDLTADTGYEVELSEQPDYSDPTRLTFRTQRTIRNTVLRSITVTPQTDSAFTLTDIDFTRAPLDGSPQLISHRFTLSQAQSVTVTAQAESSRANVAIDTATQILASNIIRRFRITVTDGPSTRIYELSLLATAPELVEFNELTSTLPSGFDRIDDMTGDKAGTTLWLLDRTPTNRGSTLYEVDFLTQEFRRAITLPRDTIGVAYDDDRNVLWITSQRGNITALNTDGSASTLAGHNFNVAGITSLAYHNDIIYAMRNAGGRHDIYRYSLSAASALSPFRLPSSAGTASQPGIWVNDEAIYTSRRQGGSGNYINAWNLMTGAAIDSLEGFRLNFFPQGIFGRDDLGLLFVGYTDETVRAYSLLSRTRVRTIGANFQRSKDIQLRRANLPFPRDLWGTSATIWVLGTNPNDLDLTGLTTRLHAFVRSTFAPDARQDIDISEIAAEVPIGVCGNDPDIYVLTGTHMRCWNKNRNRQAGLDFAHNIENPKSCWHDGTHIWIATDDALFRLDLRGRPVATVADQRLLIGIDACSVSPWQGVGTEAYLLNGLQLGLWEVVHKPQETIPPLYRCTRTVTTSYAFAPIRPRSGLLGAPAAQDPDNAESVLLDLFQATTTRTVYFSDRDESSTSTVTQNLGGSLVTITTTVTCVLARPAVTLRERDEWDPRYTKDLEEEGFTTATGLFRDGNEAYVIEDTLGVAAHLTIGADGSISRTP